MTRLLWTAMGGFCAGCRSFESPKLSSIPFIEKKEKTDPVFLSVEGPVLQIGMTRNWKLLAVIYQKDDGERIWNGEMNAMPPENGIRFYQMEFQSPVPLANQEFNGVSRPVAVAFDAKGKTGFLIRGCRFKNLYGPENSIPLSIEKFAVDGMKREFQSILSGNNDWTDAILSPNGDWLGVQTVEGEWKIIHLAEPDKMIVFPKTRTMGTSQEERETTVTRILHFSPDGSFVATLLAPDEETIGTKKQTIALWDLSVPRQIPLKKAKKLPLEALYVSEFTIRDPDCGRTAAFSSDGLMFAVRNKRNYVGIWQTAGGRLLAEFGEHLQEVTTFKFSPNDTKLVVGTGGERGRLVLWDVRKGTVLRTYDDPDPDGKRITAVEFPPDGNLVYFGNDSGSIREWKYQSPMKKKKEEEKKEKEKG